MIVRASLWVAVLLLVVASAACGEASDSSASADSGGVEDDFASFSRSLFAELHREPLDSSSNIEVGLFGDLSLSLEERVVMGRYRYRVDSTDYGHVAYMAFQVRDSLREEAPVPVFLTFARRDAAWHLEGADYGAEVSGIAEVDSQATDPPAPDLRTVGPYNTEAGVTPLQRLLNANFQAWIDAAIQRTRFEADTT